MALLDADISTHATPPLPGSGPIIWFIHHDDMVCCARMPVDADNAEGWCWRVDDADWHRVYVC